MREEEQRGEGRKERKEGEEEHGERAKGRRKRGAWGESRGEKEERRGEKERNMREKRGEEGDEHEPRGEGSVGGSVIDGKRPRHYAVCNYPVTRASLPDHCDAPRIIRQASEGEGREGEGALIRLPSEGCIQGPRVRDDRVRGREIRGH